MRNRITLTLFAASALALAGWCSVGLDPDRGAGATPAPPPAARTSGEESTSVRAVVGQFCVGCHDAEKAKGGLDLAAVVSADVPQHPQVWEKVVRRLRGRQMPPAGRTRPDEETYSTVVSQLETALDRAASKQPNPGRTDTIRRLTRTEYQNAIRDLLALHVDAAALLPADEESHGFDNVTVRELSPTLLDRYITAAQKVGRLAVGGASRSPGGDTIRVKADITQEDRVDGLPVGTRGGAMIRYTFPQDGEYDVQVRLTRDRNEHVEGLREPHELEVLLDRERVKAFTVKPPAGDKGHERVDEHLKFRLPVTAGPHDLGVTFLKNPTDLIETLRQPYNSHFNMHRHPRQTPAVYQVTITGPFGATGPGDTPSRRRIFVTRPKSPAEEEAAAKQILSTLMRRAYRRPVADADVDRLLPLYRAARREADFDAGIEAALSAILVSREFLFRVERDPPGVAPRTAYRIGELELASRLSFFLWSSIPDDELLDLAARGELRKPGVLAAQARRMLADPRSRALVTNFAGQWLHLRNLDSITPDGRIFPDFDDNLRQAMRRETELLFEEVVREDRGALGLLKSDHTFLNERLAKHYGIPHVYGPRFRRVALEPGTERGGLLRHGSVLTVTSYATRTSPVIRGKWVLENLLGTPPPPPPPNVPALDDNTVSAALPVRERLQQHRANAACASCHSLIDPTGFALENFDAVGRWRTLEEGQPVDTSGGLPDGSKFTGVTGLEDALLRRPELFVGTLTEKLFTFALGRGIEYYDGPAVREVVRAAKAADYRFSALIEAIVTSTPFQMRSSP
jgi:mono/diheme cytochrome c family protein